MSFLQGNCHPDNRPLARKAEYTSIMRLVKILGAELCVHITVFLPTILDTFAR